MNNSSVQQDYSSILNDIDLGNITINMGSTHDYLSYSDTITLDTSTITLSGGGAGTTVIGGGASSYTYTTGTGGAGITAQPIDSITIGNINSFTWETPTEWVDGFPAWDRIQEMCNMYPGLKIAFEKFKTTYKLVQDDFDAPPEKRAKP